MLSLRVLLLARPSMRVFGQRRTTDQTEQGERKKAVKNKLRLMSHPVQEGHECRAVLKMTLHQVTINLTLCLHFRGQFGADTELKDVVPINYE